ncbi:hypothetical protein BaRGS_00031052 [Batillaria attramentaria]|uniref:Uncharacterized protein n=1 Tax=Batillaria attramentaria TaxID=370345 RepID=A0ABD0JRE2_9CAEN
MYIESANKHFHHTQVINPLKKCQIFSRLPTCVGKDRRIHETTDGLKMAFHAVGKQVSDDQGTQHDSNKSPNYSLCSQQSLRLSIVADPNKYFTAPHVSGHVCSSQAVGSTKTSTRPLVLA